MLGNNSAAKSFYNQPTASHVKLWHKFTSASESTDREIITHLEKHADNQIKRPTFNLETSSSPLQVMDIAKLMKAYISMIVKKRYSNCQSVSSHGSQCSAW